MSIQEMYEKLKLFLNNDKFFYAALLVVVSVSSYGLGKLSERNISIFSQNPENTASIINIGAEAEIPVYYVASKNGTKYHLPWCPGASQMKKENKLIFETKETAEAQGYAPADNCPGI